MIVSVLRRAGESIDRASKASLGALGTWLKHLSTEIRENIFDAEDIENAKKFSRGYVIVRGIVVGLSQFVFFIFASIFVFSAAVLGGQWLWKQVVAHQAE